MQLSDMIVTEQARTAFSKHQDSIQAESEELTIKQNEPSCLFGCITSSSEQIEDAEVARCMDTIEFRPAKARYLHPNDRPS